MDDLIPHAQPATAEDYMSQSQAPADACVAYGPAPAQVVEVFLPTGSGPHPVVVLVHGGCYLAELEGLRQTSGIAADLARRGHAVWNVDYRKLGEEGAGYPGTFLDIADAVDRIRTEAPAYGLDPSRVTAVGHSAGGHLALWAAGRARLPRSSPLWRPDPLRIRAVVSLGGIGDLERHADVFAGACGAEPLPSVVGAGARADPYADTSPARLLPLGVPVRLIAGEFDHVMPPATQQALAAEMRRAGDDAEAIEIAGAGHFEVVIPTTAAWRQVAGIVTGDLVGPG